MKRIDTWIGSVYIRDKHDELVYKEVVEQDSYRRWGDIQIPKGGVVIDAGAHIGLFAKLASTCGAYIYCVEPHEGNFDLLKTNMRGRNCKLLNFALYDGNPVHFLQDAKRNELHKVADVGDLIPSITLDSLIEKYELETINLLKMDIEGSEYEVLYNCKSLDKIRQITMEWHHGSTKMAELIIFLEKNGFKVVWLGGNGDFGILQLKHI